MLLPWTADTAKVDKFCETTSTDVLNYMSSIGWTLVSIYPLGLLEDRLYYKRSFDLAEVIMPR